MTGNKIIAKIITKICIYTHAFYLFLVLVINIHNVPWETRYLITTYSNINYIYRLFLLIKS